MPAVTGDAEALHRVVENLVTNAVEALDGRGTVTVKVYAEADRAVLVVADTGRGIAAEYLRRSLFAPFRSTKKGGWASDSTKPSKRSSDTPDPSRWRRREGAEHDIPRPPAAEPACRLRVRTRDKCGRAMSER